jgi:hypothetical protein
MRGTALLLAVLCVCGCRTSGSVRVFDAEGAPVPDATLRLDYPSFNGRTFNADQDGIIAYIKQGGAVVQVIVQSPTLGSKRLQYPPPETVILDGSHWQDAIKTIFPGPRQGVGPDALFRRQRP